MWNTSGLVEAGTLRGECERVSRKGVDINVMKAYEDDKKFILNYVTANLVTAVMHFFGMENENDNATKNCPSIEDDIYNEDLMRKFVDQYIFPVWSGENDKSQDCKERERDSNDVIKITLSYGMEVQIPVIVPSGSKNEVKADKVKDYAHYGLEVGITFAYFQQLIKNPDRQKMLSLLKMMMLQLRGHSINAKYPKEILRMLVQQYSVMGVREACQVFQACFVNTTGKPNGSVPADLVQEWGVRECKKHIKHMYSNKLDSNISNRTSALPSIHAIASNFDEEACTVIRSKKHTVKHNDEDEIILIQDIKSVRPFHYTSGRYYKGFKNIPKSMSEKVDGHLLHKWFEKNKRSFFI